MKSCRRQSQRCLTTLAAQSEWMKCEIAERNKVNAQTHTHTHRETSTHTHTERHKITAALLLLLLLISAVRVCVRVFIAFLMPTTQLLAALLRATLLLLHSGCCQCNHPTSHPSAPPSTRTPRQTQHDEPKAKPNCKTTFTSIELVRSDSILG